MSEHGDLSENILTLMPPLTPEKPKRWTGWQIGIVLGIIVGLCSFPTVRYTLLAQFQFAISQDNVPWLVSIDSQRSLREAPLLDLSAAAYPDDYLIQVGRATVLAGITVNHAMLAGRNPQTDAHKGSHTSVHMGVARSPSPEKTDHSLTRLQDVVHDFPQSPGAYAHLARYMMRERVRILGKEIGAEMSISPAIITSRPFVAQTSALPFRQDIRLSLRALRTGERLDGDNAFWPSMMACVYFSAGNQDGDALAALARAARKKRWEAYVYEEVLGQWRLYSAAYGDHGATQQIGPLSLVAFPYLSELRRMAQLSRWYSEIASNEGRVDDALRIRRNLARLGIILRESAPWALEALYGTDLFFIATTDSGPLSWPATIHNIKEWEASGKKYHEMLYRSKHQYEMIWLRQEAENSCNLRQQVDLARFNASYTGIPPGIPLVALFGNWMAAITLLQAIFGLAVCKGILSAIHAWIMTGSQVSKLISRFFSFVVFLAALITGTLLFIGNPNALLAIFFLITIATILIMIMNALSSRSRLKRMENAVSMENSTFYSARPLPVLKSAIEQVEKRWTVSTTVGILLLIMVPGISGLYLFRNDIGGLHPVAVLLVSIMGVTHQPGAWSVLGVALLASAVPLSMILCCGAWASYRGFYPTAGVIVGFRRLFLPFTLCLVLAYLFLLNRTLVVDAEASRAIKKAAQNDREWVLTHVEP